MTYDDWFYYVSICYLLLLIAAAVAAVVLWRLNDAHELGSPNRPKRVYANALVLSLGMIGALASVVLFFLSQRANQEAAERTADAHKIASTAQKAAAQANDSAGKANERAALAEKQAAEISLIVQRLRQGRRLSGGAGLFVSQACAKFPGTNFDLAANPGDQEAREFMVSLANVLVEAGWSIRTYSGNTMRYGMTNGMQFGEVTVAGVVLLIHKSNQEKFRPAADALRDILNRFNVAARVDIEDWKPLGQGGSDLSTEVLHIHVGKDAI